KCNPVKNALRKLGLHGHRGHEKFIPDRYIYNSVEVRLGILQGLLDTDGRCGKTGYAQLYTTSGRLVEGVTEIVQSLGGYVTVNWRENSHNGRVGRAIAHVTITIPEFNPFRLSRKRSRRNVLRHKFRNFRYLKAIEYVGVKPCRCINVNNPSRTYLTDEFIVTHNSIAGFAEDARAVLNRDPYKKYRPRQGQKVLLLLGFGVTHVGTVIYPKLFLEGAFNIIRDERTKQWRVFKPWQEYDDAYKEKACPAPPLIPPRMVIPKTWNWDTKSAGIFKSVELKTGWKIWCFPSSGDPRQA